MGRKLTDADTPSYRHHVTESAILRDEIRRNARLIKDALMPFFSTTYTPDNKD